MKKNKLNYPHLGDVEIIEIFDYYDYPIVYVVQSKQNELFLFQVIKEENSIKEIVVNELTRKKFYDLKRNIITLQSIYNNPTFSYFFTINEKVNNDFINIKKLDLNHLHEFDIFQGHTLIGDENAENSLDDQKTIEQSKDFISATDLIFKNDYITPKINANTLIRVVKSYVSLYNLIGQGQVMFSMHEGSVKLRFEVFEQPTIFSEYSSEDALNLLDSVLGNDNINEVSNLLDNDFKKINKYREFIASLNNSDNPVEIKFFTPSSPNGKSKIISADELNNKKRDLQTIKNNFKETDITIVGSLIAFNCKTLTIKIISNNVLYTAKFPVEFSNKEDFISNKVYSFNFLKRDFVSDNGQVIQSSYYLKKLEKINSSK